MSLRKRFAADGIESYAAHPGVVCTDLGRENKLVHWFYTLGTPFLRGTNKGAATSLYCAVSLIGMLLQILRWMAMDGDSDGDGGFS